MAFRVWGLLPQGCMDGGCVSGLQWKEGSTEDTFSFMGEVENQGRVVKLQRLEGGSVG